MRACTEIPRLLSSYTPLKYTYWYFKLCLRRQHRTLAFTYNHTGNHLEHQFLPRLEKKLKTSVFRQRSDELM